MGPDISSRHELFHVLAMAFGTLRCRVFEGKNQLFKLTVTPFTYIFEYWHCEPLLTIDNKWVFLRVEHRKGEPLCQAKRTTRVATANPIRKHCYVHREFPDGNLLYNACTDSLASCWVSSTNDKPGPRTTISIPSDSSSNSSLFSREILPEPVSF